MTGSLRGDIPPVVRLGHDLVRNFEALPPDKAAVEIATHIRKFWEPRMRQELLARIRWGDVTAAPAARARRRGPRRRRRRPCRGEGALGRLSPGQGFPAQDPHLPPQRFTGVMRCRAGRQAAWWR